MIRRLRRRLRAWLRPDDSVLQLPPHVDPRASDARTDEQWLAIFKARVARNPTERRRLAAAEIPLFADGWVPPSLRAADDDEMLPALLRRQAH